MTKWPLYTLVIGVATGLAVSGTGDPVVGTLIQAVSLLPCAMLFATKPETIVPYERLQETTRNTWSRVGAFLASAAVCNAVFAGLALARR